jgi:hypothetical protein
MLKTLVVQLKNKIMENIKKYVNHPLSKAIMLGLVGSGLLIEAHPMYAGIAFGIAAREFMLAFK